MPVMASLTEWREAERRWEAADPTDIEAVELTALGVIRAWLAYQEISGWMGSDALLVADATGTFVAANAAACALLGRPLDDVLGRTVADITAPRDVGVVGVAWQSFLERGSLSGQYMVQRASDELQVCFDARAHHPIPGYFSSRLRTAEPRHAADEAHR